MLANLRALFAVVIDIVLMRRGPEHLPGSPALLGIIVAAYGAVAGLVAAAVARPGQNWPLELAISIAVTLLWFHLALRLASKSERFLQTMTAMFAVHLLFAPLRIPVVNAWVTQAQAFEQTKVPPSTLLGLLAVFIMVWQFVVNVRIVRGAFEWPWFAAVLLSVAQEFVMLLVLAAFIGGAAQPS